MLRLTTHEACNVAGGPTANCTPDPSALTRPLRTGGALATLAAVWASFEYPRADIRCVTLGSPRVGNAQFSDAAKYLIGSSYRLMHAWDPIPTVPPPQYLKHVKGRFWLRGDKAKDTKRPWYASHALVPSSVRSVPRLGPHKLGRPAEGPCMQSSLRFGTRFVLTAVPPVRGRAVHHVDASTAATCPQGVHNHGGALRRFTKYFGFAAKATDHVMKSYTGQLASITGKEMVAEELGLGPGTGAGGDARPAAQDQGGDGDGEDDEPHVFNTAQVPVGGGIVDSGDES